MRYTNLLFTYLLTYSAADLVCVKDKKERKYRSGEVSYADREYKFTS